MNSTSSKYHRTIKGASIDVYDVLTAFGVTNPATAHAVKKLLMPGQRGAKNTLQDLAEAKASIERAIQIEGETLDRWVGQLEAAIKAKGGEAATAIVDSLQAASRAVAEQKQNEWPLVTATVPRVEGAR